MTPTHFSVSPLPRLSPLLQRLEPFWEVLLFLFQDGEFLGEGPALLLGPGHAAPGGGQPRGEGEGGTDPGIQERGWGGGTLWCLRWALWGGYDLLWDGQRLKALKPCPEPYDRLVSPHTSLFPQVGAAEPSP